MIVHGKIELLAPAGSREALEAVIDAGADAVYFSEKRFAMRQHGAWLNFDAAEIDDIVAYVHGRGVRAYLAVNSLLTMEELAILPAHLRHLQAVAPDALIIQDLGVLKLVRDIGLTIPLHASTMMNIHHAHAAAWLKAHGVSRIITSRDITVRAAGDLARAAGIEVEYFVHGDMCVAQSSQCLHSGIAMGLSANRGKCLKSCRWQWSLVDRDRNQTLANVDRQYVLARKDLCLYHQIPALVADGIAALKIEGRARPAAYLHPIVAAYREAIDRYYADPAGYRTDFEALNRLRAKTLREIGTSNAFVTPGVGSSGLSGRDEPRFFSIAVDERPYAHRAGAMRGADAGSAAAQPELAVRCTTVEAAHALLDSACDWIYVGGEHYSSMHGGSWGRDGLSGFIARCQDRGKKIGIVTPRITTAREFLELGETADRLALRPPDEYLAGNLGALARLRELTDVPLHGDFSLNLWNPDAVALLAADGMRIFTAGLEADLEQLDGLGRHTTIPMECMVHGSMPGMLLEYCVIGTHLTGTSRHDPCPGPCTRRAYALRDTLGQDHWIETDQYCRNHVFMVKDLCTIDHLDRILQTGCRRLRIEGPLYDAAYLIKLVATYRQALTSLVAGTGGAALAGTIENGAPRPLTSGAYGNFIEPVSLPCTELPTDLLVRYPVEPSGLPG